MIFKLNSRGEVINQGSKNKIQTLYAPAVRIAVELIKENLHRDIHSIYLRGSLATGNGIKDLSDLDMVVITKKVIDDGQIKWRNEISKKILSNYPFITFVDITIISRDELLEGKKCPNLPIYIKTSSTLLFGYNIADKIPAVVPGRKLALKMYSDLENEFSELRKKFSDKNADLKYLNVDQPLTFWCIWTMRVLLRSSLGIVMCKKPIYTQDLVECYKQFTEIYPNFRKQMRQALVWSKNPINNKIILLEYFDTFIKKYLTIYKKEVRLL